MDRIVRGSRTRSSVLAVLAAAAIAVSSGGCGSPAPSGSAAAGSPGASPAASPGASAAPSAAPSASIRVPDLAPWSSLGRRWGTYVLEREWGKPAEARGGNGWGLDYTAAISDPYASGEDGIAALSDENDEFHLGWAVWDGTQPDVSERLYGLSGPAGSSGETILDRRTFGLNTPTHSYASYTLQYPRPNLVGNLFTSVSDAPTPPWSIVFEAARVDASSLVMRATVTNTTSAEASLHVVLKGWFGAAGPASVTTTDTGLLMPGASSTVAVAGPTATSRQASSEKGALDANLRAGGLAGDGPGRIGALDHLLTVGPGSSTTIAFGVVEGGTADPGTAASLRDAAGAAIAERAAEAGRLFIGDVSQHGTTYRDALTGLLWSESYYRWDGSAMTGDWTGKVSAHDVLIMPDKWEYPWLASWDTGFQAVAASLIDPDLAARQLEFILSERWQQPDGHVPCGEWVMDRECPPVFGWAALRVADAYTVAGRDADGIAFLGRMFPALTRQYAYWTRSLAVGGNLYTGGFLGMDNLPGRPGDSAQADASGWMAAFAGDLAGIAGRIGETAAIAGYEADRAAIAKAVNEALWDEATGFYYDLSGTDRVLVPSYSGLIPLVAGIVPEDRMPRVLAMLKDPAAFLSDHGLRSVSKEALEYRPGYVAWNSSWLGPIWLPVSYRVIEALRPVDAAFASELARRTVATVEADHLATGRFHEYFDGETGAGLGADQQTGWTALVANLIAEEWPNP